MRRNGCSGRRPYAAGDRGTTPGVPAPPSNGADTHSEGIEWAGQLTDPTPYNVRRRAEELGTPASNSDVVGPHSLCQVPKRRPDNRGYRRNPRGTRSRQNGKPPRVSDDSCWSSGHIGPAGPRPQGPPWCQRWSGAAQGAAPGQSKTRHNGSYKPTHLSWGLSDSGTDAGGTWSAGIGRGRGVLGPRNRTA